ncbi:unnamed protein product, partial [Closterium sp. Naga37s-1]
MEGRNEIRDGRKEIRGGRNKARVDGEGEWRGRAGAARGGGRETSSLLTGRHGPHSPCCPLLSLPAVLPCMCLQLQALLRMGMPAGVCSTRNATTPLHVAAYGGHVDCMCLLAAVRAWRLDSITQCSDQAAVGGSEMTCTPGNRASR